MPEYKITKFPPDDDPGWFEADVWDCPDSLCMVGRMDPDVKECLGCNTPQPEGAVYRGRCWGMKVPDNPTLKLTDIPERPLIIGPRDQKVPKPQHTPGSESLFEAEDKKFLACLDKAIKAIKATE